MQIERTEGTDGADRRPSHATAPEGSTPEQPKLRQPEPERGKPEPGDGSAPGDGAVRAERAIAYRNKVDTVHRVYAIDQGCAAVEKIETDTTTPALLRVEAMDPDRHLIGFENRLKDKDRLSQKVAKSVDELGRSVNDAFGLVKDAIRYTLCYPDDLYTRGVLADCERLEHEGFEPVDRQNSWTKEQYKGINSRWRVPENGQLFEVQFHTEDSYAAKQETHPAYEKLRVGVPTKAEQRKLEELQKQVTARVPIPPGAADIPDYL